MLVGSIARVQNRQAGDAFEQHWCAGVLMPQDDAFGAESAQGQAGVLQALALFDRRALVTDERRRDTDFRPRAGIPAIARELLQDLPWLLGDFDQHHLLLAVDLMQLDLDDLAA